MYIRLTVMYRLLLLDFIENGLMSTDIGKYSNTEFYRNSCRGRRILFWWQTDGLTWRNKLWLLAIY